MLQATSSFDFLGNLYKVKKVKLTKTNWHMSDLSPPFFLGNLVYHQYHYHHHCHDDHHDDHDCDYPGCVVEG